MADNTDVVLEAIKYIADKTVENLAFNKTITATIVNNLGDGKYQVEEGSTKYFAYSENQDYPVGLSVYVNIPNNDYNNTKTILGKVITNSSESFSYVDPLSKYFNITGNVLKDYGLSLLANDPDAVTCLGFTPAEDTQSNYIYNKDKANQYYEITFCDVDLSDIPTQGYTNMALSAQFSTQLNDVMLGTYGLHFILYANNGDSKHIYLDTNDMWGDPYNYIAGSVQNKLFEFDPELEVDRVIGLYYQKCDFYNSDKEALEYKKSSTGSLINDDDDKLDPNIFIDSISLSFGYTSIDEEKLILYTKDGSNYDPGESKELLLRWSHIINQIDKEAVAITSIAEAQKYIGQTIKVHWYKYVSGEKDEIAGHNWKEIEGAIDHFSYTFTPNGEAKDEFIKVTIEIIDEVNLEAEKEQIVAKYGDFKTTMENYKKDIEDCKTKIATLESRQTADVTPYESEIEFLLKKIQADETAMANLQVQIDKYSADISNYYTYIDSISYNPRIEEWEKFLTLHNNNSDNIVDPVVLKKIDNFEISCTNNGVFRMYDTLTNQANHIIPPQTLTAQFLAKYLTTGTIENNYGIEWMKWYIPKRNTMIVKPAEGVEYDDIWYTYNTYKNNLDELKKIQNPTQEQIRLIAELNDMIEQEKARVENKQNVKTIDETSDKDYYIILISRPLLETGSSEVYSEQTLLYNQIFRVRKDLHQTYGNNDIKCEIKLVDEDTPYMAEYTDMIFGHNSTNGTNNTLVIEMFSSVDNGVDNNNPYSWTNTTTEMQLKATFYDENNNDLTNEGALYWSIYKNNQYGINQAGVLEKYDKSEKGCVVRCDFEHDDIKYSAYLCVPYSNNGELYLTNGADRIIYNEQGASPVYNKDPYEINNVYVDDAEIYVKNQTLAQAGNPIDMPTLSINYALRAKTMYFTNSDYDLSVLMHVIIDGTKYTWAQPILVTTNAWSSSVLNDWDGEMKMDTENNYILSAMMGAGIKDEGNTFTGVVMGDTGKLDGSTTDTGLFGYQKGIQSFGFKTDGTAFIGQSGKSQLAFDGNKGTIQNGSYKDGQGMRLDFDADVRGSAISGASIDMQSKGYYMSVRQVNEGESFNSNVTYYSNSSCSTEAKGKLNTGNIKQAINDNGGRLYYADIIEAKDGDYRNDRVFYLDKNGDKVATDLQITQQDYNNTDNKYYIQSYGRILDYEDTIDPYYNSPNGPISFATTTLIDESNFGDYVYDDNGEQKTIHHDIYEWNSELATTWQSELYNDEECTDPATSKNWGTYSATKASRDGEQLQNAYFYGGVKQSLAIQYKIDGGMTTTSTNISEQVDNQNWTQLGSTSSYYFEDPAHVLYTDDVCTKPATSYITKSTYNYEFDDETKVWKHNPNMIYYVKGYRNKPEDLNSQLYFKYTDTGLVHFMLDSRVNRVWDTKTAYDATSLELANTKIADGGFLKITDNIFPINLQTIRWYYDRYIKDTRDSNREYVYYIAKINYRGTKPAYVEDKGSGKTPRYVNTNTGHAYYTDIACTKFLTANWSTATTYYTYEIKKIDDMESGEAYKLNSSSISSINFYLDDITLNSYGNPNIVDYYTVHDDATNTDKIEIGLKEAFIDADGEAEYWDINTIGEQVSFTITEAFLEANNSYFYIQTGIPVRFVNSIGTANPTDAILITWDIGAARNVTVANPKQSQRFLEGTPYYSDIACTTRAEGPLAGGINYTETANTTYHVDAYNFIYHNWIGVYGGDKSAYYKANTYFKLAKRSLALAQNSAYVPTVKTYDAKYTYYTDETCTKEWELNLTSGLFNKNTYYKPTSKKSETYNATYKSYDNVNSELLNKYSDYITNIQKAKKTYYGDAALTTPATGLVRSKLTFTYNKDKGGKMYGNTGILVNANDDNKKEFNSKTTYYTDKGCTEQAYHKITSDNITAEKGGYTLYYSTVLELTDPAQFNPALAEKYHTNENVDSAGNIAQGKLNAANWADRSNLFIKVGVRATGYDLKNSYYTDEYCLNKAVVNNTTDFTNNVYYCLNKSDAQITLQTKSPYFTIKNALSNSLIEIKDDDAKIANWHLKETELYNGDAHLYSANQNYNTTVRGHSANNWRIRVGYKFGVDANGNLYAQDADFKDINVNGLTANDAHINGLYAKNGSIDNVTIGNATITNGSITNADVSGGLRLGGTSLKFTGVTVITDAVVKIGGYSTTYATVVTDVTKSGLTGISVTKKSLKCRQIAALTAKFTKTTLRVLGPGYSSTTVDTGVSMDTSLGISI